MRILALSALIHTPARCALCVPGRPNIPPLPLCGLTLSGDMALCVILGTGTLSIALFLGGGSSHGKLAKPAHEKALEKSLGIKDQRCPMLRLSHNAMW